MSLSRAILERRVPHYLVLYLGVSWGLVQFVNFLEDRYALSPHLTDLTLLGVALLIPGVLVFTYNHGRPGKDEWSLVEKIGIPFNVVVAAVVLVFLFRDKPLGATVRMVDTRDEGGQTIARPVASASYRKRLALFNFDGPADDTSVAWLRYGLPYGIAADLNQDMFVDVRPSGLFRQKLLELGYRDEVDVPRNLKRTIAGERHLPFFNDARVSRSGDTIKVDFALYESAGGALVQRRIYSGTDVFALIDEITAGLKRDLELPETAKVRDFPVSEVVTSSLPAFRQYVDAMNVLQFQNDWARGTTMLEKAAQLDPTFALAWLSLHNVLVLSSQSDRSLPPLQKALDLVYRLPERMQYDVKAEYYMVKQDAERAYQAASTKVALFPDDISGYNLLIQMQSLRNDRDGMIASLHKIMELDATQQERLRDIAALYEAKNEPANALRYYTQYTERFPNQADAFVSIGNLQRRRNEPGLARASFDKALVIRPGVIPALLGLARLDRDLGNFEPALKSYNEALAAARTPADSTGALEGLASYHEFRGQLALAISHTLRAHEVMARSQPPTIVAMRRLGLVELYARAGQFEQASQLVKRVETEVGPLLNSFAALGAARLVIEQGKLDEAEQAVQRLDQAIATSGYQALRHPALIARARLHELRNDCGQALARYQEAQQLEPSDVTVSTAIGRCYRVMRQPERAIEAIRRTLSVMPANGRANYEIGLAYRDAGDRAKALEHLTRAVKTWESADASLQSAAQARAALAKVEEMRPVSVK